METYLRINLVEIIEYASIWKTINLEYTLQNGPESTR